MSDQKDETQTRDEEIKAVIDKVLDEVTVGRPSKYEAKFADQATKLCRLGATDMELAEFFEVTVRTIYRWKIENEKFCHALKAGKEEADARVERAFYNRAVGYTYDSEKIFHSQGVVTRAKCKEHVPPDPGAAFSWLKNRKPDEWRDKKEIGGHDGGPLEVVIKRFTPDPAIDTSPRPASPTAAPAVVGYMQTGPRPPDVAPETYSVATEDLGKVLITEDPPEPPDGTAK